MSTELAILLLAFFILVVALSLLKTRYIEGRAIFLLRALFPSWRFFEEITEIPRLSYRWDQGNTEFGPWTQCFEKPKRKLSNFILNPEGNLLFAYGGILQHLLHDLENIEEDKTEEFMGSTSYQLVMNLARFHIRQQKEISENLKFQFKISTLLQGEDDRALEDVFISATHQV